MSAATSFTTGTSRCLGSGASSSSKAPQISSKVFLPTAPARIPPITLNGMNRNLLMMLGLPPDDGSSSNQTVHRLATALLGRAARLDERLLVGRQPALDNPRTLDLGVPLRSQEHGDVGDPKIGR